MSESTVESVTEKLLGAWKLVSFELHEKDGSVKHPMGTHVLGQLHYARGGWMMVQGIRDFDVEPRDASVPSSLDSFDGFGYHGTFVVKPSEGVVVHDAWISADPPPHHKGPRVRRYTFSPDGNSLALSGTAVDGREMVIRWERLPSQQQQS